MLKYESLSAETEAKIRADLDRGASPRFGFDDNDALRRRSDHDRTSLIRTPFIRDIDKILHCPYYNRYTDKTQVFSFYKNDDISRRALHVQLVSRIARTIGRTLNLNLDLIEAIALGHDIGHTPFGHAGEEYLDELFYSHAGRHFSHNVHSVRVLDRIFPYNISLQTLNGIAAHDGEMELSEYRPAPLDSFKEFDRQLEACYADRGNVKKLVPATLEGCVVRISDIISYLGKDRQDAERAKLLDGSVFTDSEIGLYNAQIINNLTVNIIENSYGKPYIKMDEAHFSALKTAKEENNRLIYKVDSVRAGLSDVIRPMMERIYERILADLKDHDADSPVFTHHIKLVNAAHYEREFPYEQTEPNQIAVDYIASMTDDYFLDLYAHLFPGSDLRIEFKGYFG